MSLGNFIAMFGSRKILRKKNVKKNDFLIFSFIMENTKETQNIIKISKKLIYF